MRNVIFGADFDVFLDGNLAGAKEEETCKMSLLADNLFLRPIWLIFCSSIW